MNHAAIIDELGGHIALAEAIRRDVTRVRKWRHAGIPRLRWPEVVEIARKKRKRHITLDLLAAGETIPPPPLRRRRPSAAPA